MVDEVGGHKTSVSFPPGNTVGQFLPFMPPLGSWDQVVGRSDVSHFHAWSLKACHPISSVVFPSPGSGTQRILPWTRGPGAKYTDMSWMEFGLPGGIPEQI